MSRLAIILAAAVLWGGIGFAAFAADPAVAINDRCPVDGEAVRPVTSSVTVKFCCEKCKAKFDKAPVGYLNTTKDLNRCPVTGKPAKEGVTSTVTVAFCSEKCKASFEKEPTAYLANIRAAQ